MKFIVFLITNCLFYNICLSQNVGVGTTTPGERLDVNGNINVSGTIKANGTDGQPNQVLMKNESGIFTWGNLCDYKNRAFFDGTGANSWTVPATVDRITIELWGGGGGGSSYSGGGGGGYIVATFTVVPGDIVNLNVGQPGSGGNGVNTAGTNGGATTVSVSPRAVTASGGMGAGGGSQIPSAYGGLFSVSGGFLNFFGVRGEAGQTNEHNFTNNGTNALESISKGRGGNAGNTTNTGGNGAYRIVFVGTPASTVRYTLPEQGRQPGGGGGAGFSMISGGGTNSGFGGAPGAVVIHF